MKSKTKILLEAIKKRKFSIEEAAEAILKSPAPEIWKHSDNDIIVKSNGKTGKQWLGWLKREGWDIDDYARALLLSPDFIPTKGVFTKIVFKKYMPIDDIGEVKNEAKRLRLKVPNPEVMCLICEYFSTKEFGERSLYSIAVMHNPMKPALGFGASFGNFCIKVPTSFSKDPKTITALELKDYHRLSGWAYAFEKEM